MREVTRKNAYAFGDNFGYPEFGTATSTVDSSHLESSLDVIIKPLLSEHSKNPASRGGERRRNDAVPSVKDVRPMR